MRLIDADALMRKAVETFYTTNYFNHISKMIEDAPTIDTEPHWIPCSDMLPEKSGDYMLYRPHFWGANTGQITVCYWNNHDWSDNYRNDSERYLPIIDGMAWMPLPQPYKGGETDG